MIAGSAKTWHNCCRLKFTVQANDYNMLNTCISKKIVKTFFLRSVVKQSSYSPIREELENLAVDCRIGYISLFTSCQNYHNYVINFSSQILFLYMVKESDTRKTYPSNRYPCSWQTRWCKLQLCVKFHS